MVLNPNTICKPLNYRELEFYQNIQDQDIKMFVPKYKGKQSIDFSPLFFIKSLIISYKSCICLDCDVSYVFYSKFFLN